MTSPSTFHMQTNLKNQCMKKISVQYSIVKIKPKETKYKTMKLVTSYNIFFPILFKRLTKQLIGYLTDTIFTKILKRTWAVVQKFPSESLQFVKNLFRSLTLEHFKN